ncbi:MAG: ABC transporter ATP-binding protein [Actinobacteria bacterium HGW-Actinobacteria-10]|jgi:molybdopterin-binding protein|nr:MAG: ABC transporter ATP-binding protein [Actinobacteria bacterium HGW-Actinobacteria-10]
MSRGISLSARGLRRSFRTGFSVEVEDIRVQAGRTLALLGPSGSGKSTLLTMMGLLERPDAGTIFLDGREVTYRDHQARQSIAAVFQRPYLIRGTVGENVAYGLKLRGVVPQERNARVEATLVHVGLAGFSGRFAATLSGGEAQRVALARALVLEPRVLLLDEPLASLDPLLKRTLTGEFASILRDEGVTVLYVTHDHDEALIVADEIAVMNEGHLVTQGPAADVMGLPADSWTAEFLGMEPPTTGRVISQEGGLVHIDAGGTVIAAVGTYPPGTPVLFAVAPEDVLLAATGADIGATSARNRFTATVTAIEPRGSTWRVILTSGSVRIASSVSRAALDEIGLARGDSVQALFKATAVRVRAAE